MANMRVELEAQYEEQSKNKWEQMMAYMLNHYPTLYVIRSRLHKKIHCKFQLGQLQDQWHIRSKMYLMSLLKVFGQM